MGWGVVKAVRMELLGHARVARTPAELRDLHATRPAAVMEPQTSDFVVVDMNAEVRRLACGDTPRSAAALARTLCRSNCARGRRMAFLMFDNPARNHSERARLHERRYATPPLAQGEVESAVARGDVVVANKIYPASKAPYTEEFVRGALCATPLEWGRVWPRGKRGAFELVERACVEWHHGTRDDERGSDATVVWHTRDPVVYPYAHSEGVSALTRRCCDNTYGEADGKVADAVRVLAASGSVCVQTVDTDMILQILAQPGAHAFQAVTLRLKNESLDMNALVATYGGDDYARRLTHVFWMLTCNGVDYCRGLTGYGFAVKDLAAVARHPDTPLFVLGKAGHAHFNVGACVATLARLTRRNRKGLTWGMLEDELAAILFCLSLFSGACSRADGAAGPQRAALAVDLGVGEGTPLDAGTWAGARALRITCTVALEVGIA